MRSIFRTGDKKQYKTTVSDADLASFHGEVVHPVCSTFALARDFEWSSRLFFLEMKEDDEEGVGTELSIHHSNPAFVGEEIIFTATIEKIEGMRLLCAIEARVNDRVIATGTTGQKMLKKEKLTQRFLRGNQGNLR